MSEYQYYEFQAIDRRLTEEEQSHIRSLSRRVALTPTQAVFTYSFGDFRSDPRKVLEEYFDAMLYLANWGTKQLAFRLPRSLLQVEALAPYCFPHAISTSVTGDHVILDIHLNEEEGVGWIEGEGSLSSLVGLRQDLLYGDFRLLYLAWLKAAQLEEGMENGAEQLEPPVPPNLRNLSGPLQSFVELFEIDEDLMAVAAEASPQQTAAELRVEELIARLSEEERNDYLIRLARGEPHVSVQLVSRLRELSQEGRKGEAPAAAHRRTLSELFAAARERSRRRQEQQRQEAERARIRKLEALAEKAPELWVQISALIEKKQTKAYDEAVAMLKELHELAKHRGQVDRFTSRVNQIQEEYRNRPALLSRLRDAGLVKGEK